MTALESAFGSAAKMSRMTWDLFTLSSAFAMVVSAQGAGSVPRGSPRYPPTVRLSTPTLEMS
jgi:hypothetical protein